MQIAKAFANNDVVLLVWSYDSAIPGCLGFCIKRKDTESGKIDILESMVGFKKSSITKHQFKSTTVWPIQKFNWRDFSARSGATYEYTIVPMLGTQNSLREAEIGLQAKTNQVKLTGRTGNMEAYFNRGILSTQYVSSQIPKSASGAPNYTALLDRIKQPGDTLRNRLADELRAAVPSLLQKAVTEHGECYCALYELNDPELVTQLLSAKGRVHLILSNTGPDDEINAMSRMSLHDAGVDVIDRFLSSGHIGHNKFVVYVNARGVPEQVLTGSTNWTSTALCAQSNNALLVRSEELAREYLDYWKRLKADAAKQAAGFRQANNAERSVVAGGSTVSLWFSPNTTLRTKPSNDPKTPQDMEAVFDAMGSAQKSIVFLAFQPGAPSIIDKATAIQTAKPDLFIRGAVSDVSAVENANVTLFHRGVKAPVIVAPGAIKDDFAFWMAELLKSSPTAHAIIHDKIVVVDAFTDDSVVITGSHNLGYRASYNNDENLLIIRGNKELATMYATHVMDVYDHYRWRFYLNKNKKKFTGLNSKDTWQAPYFNNKRGESIDRRFWL